MSFDEGIDGYLNTASGAFCATLIVLVEGAGESVLVLEECLRFWALDVSDVAVVAARRSRVEWENRQREKKGQPLADAGELISAAWSFVRERFREYQKSRREHGLKRHRAKKDAPRSRKDIEQLVRLQLKKEIRNGRFFGGLDAVRAEIERRVSERMKLSRGKYSRLDDDLLVAV